MKIKILIFLIFLSYITNAQPGIVQSYQRISYNEGNCIIPPDSTRNLGRTTCFLGDLDGDGRKEIFSICPSLVQLGYLISLNPDGTVYKYKIIGRNVGLPNNATPSWYNFGASCANIGDLNNDGVTDLAIGNSGESGYGGDVFIIFLNSDGTVKSFKVLAASKNGFNVTLGSNDLFGNSITCLGDIDNNQTTELVIGAPYTNDGAIEAGAIWILSIDSTGTCTDYKKISHTSGGGSILNVNAVTTRFGYSSVKYQDINGDNIPEFFIGAPYAQFKGALQGKFYGISLNANKTIKSFKLVSDTSQNFGDTLINPSFLSQSIGNLGDIDSNGFEDIVVSSPTQGFYGSFYGRGHVRLLLMEDNFKIKTSLPWDSLLNGVPAFDRTTSFGFGLMGLGDINKDGKLDALVGLPTDHKNQNLYGAMYVLFLDGKKYTTQSIKNKPYSSNLNIYPNPIKNEENILIQLPIELIGQSIDVSITSSLGQKVISGIYQSDGNTLSMLNHNLPPGIYFINLKNENQYYHTTLILQ